MQGKPFLLGTLLRMLPNLNRESDRAGNGGPCFRVLVQSPSRHVHRKSVRSDALSVGILANLRLTEIHLGQPAPYPLCFSSALLLSSS